MKEIYNLVLLYDGTLKQQNNKFLFTYHIIFILIHKSFKVLN